MHRQKAGLISELAEVRQQDRLRRLDTLQDLFVNDAWTRQVLIIRAETLHYARRLLGYKVVYAYSDFHGSWFPASHLNPALYVRELQRRVWISHHARML